MTIRLKKKKTKRKTHKIEVRVSLDFKNILKQKALLYCGGNLSEYILAALSNYEIKGKDLEEKSP